MGGMFSPREREQGFCTSDTQPRPCGQVPGALHSVLGWQAQAIRDQQVLSAQLLSLLHRRLVLSRECPGVPSSCPSDGQPPQVCQPTVSGTLCPTSHASSAGGDKGLDGPPAQGSPSQGQVASLWAKTWLSQAVTAAGPESCCLVPEPHAKVSRAMTLRRTLERPSGLCKPPLGAGFQPGPHVRIPQLGRRWLEKVETQAPRWTHERHLQGTSPASAMF